MPLQRRKLEYPPDERKTTPWSMESDSLGNYRLDTKFMLPNLVRVEFTGADWERAKGKIVSYNKQLEKQR